MATIYWPQAKNPFPPKTLSHRIADIRSRKPFMVICTCGWHEVGVDSLDIERIWKQHKRDNLERTS